MGVNGVELKAGQVWKDRNGREVTIAEKEDSEFGFVTWREGGKSYIYETGSYWRDGKESQYDLIELVQDENGWRPWEATADSQCPVDGDTKVRYRLSNGREHEWQAGGIIWKDSLPAASKIVAYKIVEKAVKPDAKPAEPPRQEPPAIRLLQVAADHMRDRAATYDKPGGERSMGKTIAAFNAVTGRDLREAEGWLLIQLLKDVRLFSAPGYHADSAEDCIAYAALKAEAKAGEVA